MAIWGRTFPQHLDLFRHDISLERTLRYWLWHLVSCRESPVKWNDDSVRSRRFPRVGFPEESPWISFTKLLIFFLKLSPNKKSWLSMLFMFKSISLSISFLVKSQFLLAFEEVACGRCESCRHGDSAWEVQQPFPYWWRWSCIYPYNIYTYANNTWCVYIIYIES